MKQSLEIISINKIFDAIVHRIVPIILCTVLCTGVAFVYYSFFVDKKYSANVSIIVDNRSTEDVDEENNPSQKKTNADITASRMMAETYIAILKNDAVLTSIADRVNNTNDDIIDGYRNEISPKQLKTAISMAAVNDTEILKITSTTTDPQLSVDICSAVVEEAKVVLRQTMNTLTVNSIEGDNIILPTAPISPNVTRSTLLVAFLAFAAGCGVAIVIALLDLTVKASDDVAAICGFPVIGEIPSIKTEPSKKPFESKGWKH